MTSASDEKWRTFDFFFQSREQVVVRRGHIRRVGWANKTLEAQVGQFLLGCKCPVSLGIVVTLPRPMFFLQNVLKLHQQRWVILRVDNLALWKIINEEDAVLIPKNRGEKFPSDFALGIFGGGVSRYAVNPLIVTLSRGRSDITRFRPWSPFATGNHLDLAENIPKFLRRLAPLKFLIHVQAFRGPLRGELSLVQTFMNDGPNPLTWDVQLLSYWFSRNPAVFQD